MLNKGAIVGKKEYLKIKCFIQLWLPVLLYCVLMGMLLVLYPHSLCITWLLLEKAGITY